MCVVTVCYSPKKQGCVWSLPVIHLKSKDVCGHCPLFTSKARMCVVTACYPPKKQGYAVTACYPLQNKDVQSLPVIHLTPSWHHVKWPCNIIMWQYPGVRLGLRYTTSLRFTLPNKFRMSYLSFFPWQSLPGFWSRPLHCLWTGPARQWEISFTLTGLWTHHTSENIVIKTILS